MFIRIKIARKFKFYIWIIISGNKSVKKGQKMPKKATSWTYNAFSKKKFVFANLKCFNDEKKCCYYATLGFFFPLCEFKGPFSRLLTRANKYRKILSEFFYQINHRALSIGIPKYPENWWFYVVKLQKFGPKMAILDPETF